jgi:hypothetical protein
MRGATQRSFSQFAIVLIVFHLMLATAVAQTEQSVAVQPPVTAPATSMRILTDDSDVIKRVQAASGDQRVARVDVIIEGSVILQTPKGPVGVPVTITRSSNGGQHIRFNQSDGRPWDGTIEHLELNTRRILEFVQIQHDRALPHLLDAASRNATIINAGMQEGVQRIVVREATGTATQYVFDAATARLTRMEFARPRLADGQTTASRDAYVYSDVRTNAGIATAYAVEHFSNGTKQEALAVSSVRTIQVNPRLARGRRP